MGAYAGIIGRLIIEENRKEEFARRVADVFKAGGMAKTEHVSIDGGKRGIFLLVPPEPEYVQDGFTVNYNYLEDNWWQPISFDAKEIYFFSEKIGGGQFAWTYIAALMLAEQYADGECLTRSDGVRVPLSESIGWLNYLFHENYTAAIRNDAGRIMQLLKKYSYNSKEAEKISWDDVRKYIEDENLLYDEPLVPLPSSEYLEVEEEDLIYSWKADRNLKFSDKMKDTFTEWKAQYSAILESDNFETISEKEFCRKMMEDVERIDNDFGRIMVWRDMFYDYLMHAENRRYQASWELLRRLAHEHAKDSKVIALQKWMETKPWEFIKTELKKNDSRMLIKRYLSTLYNTGLRKEVFGF